MGRYIQYRTNYSLSFDMLQWTTVVFYLQWFPITNTWYTENCLSWYFLFWNNGNSNCVYFRLPIYTYIAPEQAWLQHFPYKNSDQIYFRSLVCVTTNLTPLKYSFPNQTNFSFPQKILNNLSPNNQNSTRPTFILRTDALDLFKTENVLHNKPVFTCLNMFACLQR